MVREGIGLAGAHCGQAGFCRVGLPLSDIGIATNLSKLG
jgi:hypothetical protein